MRLHVLRRTTGVVLLPIALSVLARPLPADVRLPAVLGDHMVLQQNSPVALWGWADAMERVTVTASWDGKPATVTADTEGRWRVILKSDNAGGPHTVTLVGNNTITLRDVLLGEVWLASGQSNMEWPVASSLNATEEIASAEHPQIRLFTVERASSSTPLDTVTGKWEVCSSQTAGKFSAVAYYFGRSLHTELKTPIGLIASSWGGTEIEKWIPEPAMLADAEFAASIQSRRAALKDYDAAWEAWRKENDAADPGAAGHWEDPALDDKDWTAFPAYKSWDSPELGGFDGVVWFRGSVEIPASWAGQSVTLELGAIDDQDRTYVNGKLVGATTDWSAPRIYAISGGDLRPGHNSIVIRVHDTGGLGGFTVGAEQPCAKRGDEKAPIGQWKYRIGVAQSALKPPPESPAPQNSVLYNAMIAPLTPMTVRGFIWYQGESNVARAAQYQRAFPMMIAAWRNVWGGAELPFYYVQIAPFSGYSTWNLSAGAAAELREAQRLTLKVPYTGMVVTTDLVPDPADIHPLNKQAVGLRLSRLALADAYGLKGITANGPAYREMKIEGGAIRLTFDHVGSGIDVRGGTLSGFTIAGEDRQFVAADAKKDGDTVVVSSPQVKRPVAVRFAWEDALIPSFFNRDGYPASPFRTDDWPMATEKARW